MKVNAIDARKYDARQLTVEIQPPEINVNYEWITGAIQPIEFETDVKMGHLKLGMYFKGKDGNSIIRSMSEFMMNFTQSCVLVLDGYKGKYKGFLTSSDYEKTISKKRRKLNLEFDGFFFDDELEIEFDGVSSGTFYMVGSRKVPCIIEVYAKSALTNYAIKGFGDNDIVVEKLEMGKTVIIDGTKGLVTAAGKNAFESVNMWEFPEIKTGGTTLTFANKNAVVKIRYKPMWI